MNKKYDIIVVGLGPSAVFLAYEMIKLNSNKKFIFEKGGRIEIENAL